MENIEITAETLTVITNKQEKILEEKYHELRQKQPYVIENSIKKYLPDYQSALRYMREGKNIYTRKNSKKNFLINSMIAEFKEFVAEICSIEDDRLNDIENCSCEMMIEQLSDPQKIALEKKYKDFCSKQPSIIQSDIRKYLPTYHDAAKFYNGKIKIHPNRASKKGKLLNNMISGFKVLVSQLYKNNNILWDKKKNRSITSVAYLTSEQIEWANNFYQEHDHLPMFFILKQYLCGDKLSEKERLLSYLSGLNQEGIEYSYEEASKKIRRSQKITRQLSYLKLIKDDELLAPELWEHYYTKDFVKKGDELFARIKEEEQTDVSLNAYYLVRKQMQSCAILKVKCEAAYFLSQKLSNLFDFKKAVSKISELRPNVYDINDYIPAKTKNKETILSILKEILSESYNIDIIDNKITITRQNTYNDIEEIAETLYNAINKSDKPLNIKELRNYLPSKRFNNTKYLNEAVALMHKSKPDIIAMYNNLYAIKGRKYKLESQKEEKNSNIFEDRFLQLNRFIEQNKRFPFEYSSNVMENIVYRFVNEMLDGKIDVTIEQEERFDSLIKTHDNIPHDINDFIFLMNCQKYKKHVSQHHKRPTLKDDKELYEWYNRSISDYNNLRCRQKKWITDMIGSLSRTN